MKSHFTRIYLSMYDETYDWYTVRIGYIYLHLCCYRLYRRLSLCAAAAAAAAAAVCRIYAVRQGLLRSQAKIAPNSTNHNTHSYIALLLDKL